MRVETPEPGLYADVPAEIYFSWDAISQGTLHRMEAQCPAIARYTQTHGIRSSAALEFGSKLHRAILEPGAFQPILRPGAALNTKAGVAELQGWFEEHADALAAAGFFFDAAELEKPRLKALRERAGPYTMDPAEAKRIRDIRDAILSEPRSRELFECDGLNELSGLFTDDDFGKLLRMRLDRLLDGRRLIVDLKSTANASPRKFNASIANNGYAFQAAVYLDGIACLTGTPVDEWEFAFLAYESEPPHASALYLLDHAWIDYGRERYRANLERYVECEKLDSWPNYETQTLSPPGWIR